MFSQKFKGTWRLPARKIWKKTFLPSWASLWLIYTFPWSFPKKVIKFKLNKVSNFHTRCEMWTKRAFFTPQHLQSLINQEKFNYLLDSWFTFDFIGKYGRKRSYTLSRRSESFPRWVNDVKNRPGKSYWSHCTRFIFFHSESTL